MKYFLIQAYGSSLLLLGYFFTQRRGLLGVVEGVYFGNYLIIFRLLVKVGMFPFHSWLPIIMGGLRWGACLVLGVLQKIIPLFVLRRVVNRVRGRFLLALGGLGSLIGGVGGINQSQIRVLIAYSSIGHIGWILVGLTFSFCIFCVYYVIYAITSSSLILFLKIYTQKNVGLSRFSHISPFTIFVFGSLLLSLGGIPPFLGFFGKLKILQICVRKKIYLLCSALISGSLLNIYYYLNILFSLALKSFYGGAKSGGSLAGLRKFEYFSLGLVLILRFRGLGLIFIF